MGKHSMKQRRGCLLKQQITYTFHNPNPPEILYKALVELAAQVALKTVERSLKEQEESTLKQLTSGI